MNFPRKISKQAVALLLLAIIPAFAVLLFHPNRPVASATPEVSIEEIKKWNESVLWIDARSEADFELGHIPGALRLSEADWETLIDDFLDVWDMESRIVVYCGGGDCLASRGVAARLMQEAGIERIYILKGGFKAWKKAP